MRIVAGCSLSVGERVRVREDFRDALDLPPRRVTMLV